MIGVSEFITSINLFEKKCTLLVDTLILLNTKNKKMYQENTENNYYEWDSPH